MNEKRCCYELVFLDVAHKWLDDTKTTLELVYYNEYGDMNVLAYIHSNDTIEEVKLNKEGYIDLMLDNIKKHIKYRCK